MTSTSTISDSQFQKIKTAPGFIAALDQSGGSTPKALRIYGIEESEYSGDDAMFDLVHEMRTRIMTNESFNGDRVLAAILFEMTMDRTVGGKPTSQYLWSEKQVVPFLKIDKGLADTANGVQIMKPIPGLDELLERAKKVDVFGTKMRSVIHDADGTGIAAIVKQQFEISKQILSHGLVPIIEPEVSIDSPQKAQAEQILLNEINKQLDALDSKLPVMFKLTLPETANFYSSLVSHPKILRVVALSGGYSREVATQKLSANNGVIASFSRALSEGLSAQQSDAEFTQVLGTSIQAIFDASNS
jgi:fructose-bisphosphate aldolase class I